MSGAIGTGPIWAAAASRNAGLSSPPGRDAGHDREARQGRDQIGDAQHEDHEGVEQADQQTGEQTGADAQKGLPKRVADDQERANRCDETHRRPDREIHAAEENDGELTQGDERQWRDLQCEIAEIERRQEIG